MEQQLNYCYLHDFQLENGAVVPELKIAYQTFGTRNEDDSNIVWVFHALTANSNPFEWWSGLFGKETLFNETSHFVVCVNTIGSPYGSTAPADLNFPLFTVRDVVNAEMEVATHLNINRIHTAIGGSFGGNQALEFAYAFKGMLDNLVLIASSAKESAWSIAIHESQRMALKADPTFGKPDGGKEGLKAARSIGMLTYRTSFAFEQTQTDPESKLAEFKASSYIRYQGEKFEKRFNALSYFYLIQCLDTHDVGRNRGGVEVALNQIKTKTLIVAIKTDVLIPPRQQKYMAGHMPNARYHEIDSEFGHDGFLIETDQLTNAIQHFYSEPN